MRGCRQVYWLQLALGDLRIDDRFDILLTNCEGGFHVTLDQARGDVEGVLKGGREDCVWVKHLVAKQVNPPIVNKNSLDEKFNGIIFSLPVHKLLDQKFEAHEQRICEK